MASVKQIILKNKVPVYSSNLSETMKTAFYCLLALLGFFLIRFIVFVAKDLRNNGK